jgi:hypothetical protein
LNFVAGTLSDFADPAIDLFGVVDLVTAAACDIDLVIEVVAGFVHAVSELAAKNCLETRLAGKLLEALQKQKRSQRTIILLT